jgi:diaminopimelate decarboxylase
VAARAIFDIAREARATHGLPLAFVDAGGGFAVDYAGDGAVRRPADFVVAARAEQRAAGVGDLALYVEPGRSLVAAHGVLVARVVQEKRASGGQRRWLMIDAGMNDLIRPALYQARHRIVPLEATDAPSVAWRVVGPVCESSDDFGEHELPSVPPREVAILDAGAYGFTMASRYNGRALPAEVFVAGGSVVQVRPRASEEAWVRDRLM